MAVGQRIRIRRDTAANWTSVNPTLGLGELGLESDTGFMKAGDGSTAWTSLGYILKGSTYAPLASPPFTGLPTVNGNDVIVQPVSGLETNLAAAWNLDGHSIDSVGSKTGTDTAITYNGANGRYGIGAGFNGTTSKIDLPNLITGQSDLTVVAWMKCSVTTGEGVILSQRDGSGSGFLGSFVFQIKNNKLYFWDIRHDGAVAGFNNTTGFNNTNVCDGNWHMVGFTKSGVNGTYYLDGVADGTKTAASNVTYTAITSSIGYNRRDTAGSWFPGSLCKIEFWTRAASAAEMLSLYNDGRGRSYPFYR